MVVPLASAIVDKQAIAALGGEILVAGFQRGKVYFCSHTSGGTSTLFSKLGILRSMDVKVGETRGRDENQRACWFAAFLTRSQMVR